MMAHKGKKFPCDHCEHQASRKGDLKQHIQSVHEGMKYPYSICQYQATTASSLRQHKKSIHEGKLSKSPETTQEVYS